ncbi:MAG TPA: thioredoxin [Lachnospiraceae bacterium]|nr:thioredoxin [Lachnospiraceae bacterium]
MINKIQNNNFEEVKSAEVAVVDFSATWCGPCKMLAPVFDELSNEMTNAKFFSADVDENSDLATKYGISSVPTIIVFKGGTPVAANAGFMPKEVIKGWIEDNI